MTTRKCEEGRPGNGTALDDTDVTSVPRARTAWLDNLARMARKAAADQSFYDVAGATVQHLADEIRAGESK